MDAWTIPLKISNHEIYACAIDLNVLFLSFKWVQKANK